MASMKEVLAALKEYGAGRVVSCPVFPVVIPGIAAVDAFDANDCFGTVVTISVPVRGVIYSATFWDYDDEGTQIDLEVFKEPIVQTASDAAWSPADGDMRKFVAEIEFFAFDDHIISQTSEVKNIGKAYTAPGGKLYIQAVCRSTPTIAAGASPEIQLQILSDEPGWEER